MKLYNLYQEVILEEKQKQLNLLNEAISDGEIKAAIQGKYNVNIKYRDYDDGTPPSTRYIQIYVLGTTKAGNPAIRAYQIQGGTKTETPGWKMFRLDRIESIKKTGMPWYNPVSDKDANIPAYNQLGDDSFASIIMQVDPEGFKRQRSSIGQNPATREPVMAKAPTPVKEPVVNKPEAPRRRTIPKEPEQNVAPTKPRPKVTRQKPNEPEIGNDKEELEKDKYGNTNTAIR